MHKMGLTKETAENFIQDRIACEEDPRFGTIRQIVFATLEGLRANGVKLEGLTPKIARNVVQRLVREYESLMPR